MDQSALQCCSFCQKCFKSLGNHYKGCPERHGADYQHLLSQGTLSNKARGKPKKLPCPKCGKRFIRLETHLRRSASCKNVSVPDELSDPPPIHPVPAPSSPSSPVQPKPPAAYRPLPPTLLPRTKLPSTPEQWSEVDDFTRANITTAVLQERDVNAMQHVITHGLYTFLVSRFGIMPVNHRHHHLQRDNLPSIKKNALREVNDEKKLAKRELRRLRRSGSSPEEVRSLAEKFHLLVRKHSKLVREANKLTAKASAKQLRRECHKDIHRFARRVLDDECCTSIQPSFNQQQAEEHFSQVYSATPRTFTRPEWMPDCPPPSIPMSTAPFTEEELSAVISGLKSSSAPSPADQVPYLVFKKCPSLLPALLHLFNCCWSIQSVPAAWKVGIVHLLGKAKATDDPSNPSHFRPIALTSCVSKVFTSLVKKRWLSYMVDNHFLNTATQKAFINGVPGCSEHHLKLLSILQEASRRRKSLCICWLDLANAFGSVHHDLITFALAHYHAPPELIQLVTNIYDGLTAVVSTKSWTTAPIHLQLGVYQGDPLSAIIFNTVMNTLVDSIIQRYSQLGYSLNSAHSRINLLQYADDTCLIGDGPSSCQRLLSITESWLDWSGMRANVPKCVSVAIKASTGKAYNPTLKLNNEPIPYLGETTFRFLGAPVAIHSTSDQSREHLVSKLTSMLQKIDATSITRQQKLKLFKVSLCPRLTWDLSISDLPISWLQSQLQPIATRFLKRWSGLARSADPNRLFLPRANGGLELPHLVTMYKKLHASKAGSHMLSSDSSVRAIATQVTLRESQLQRVSFRPHQVVVGVMEEDPGAPKKKVLSRVKAKIQAEDTASKLAHTSSLPVQGLTVREYEGSAAQNWSIAVFSLPEWIFKFALNAVTDTLPHNVNLCKWKKLSSPQCQLCGETQSLAHILNSCQKALVLGRYSIRHDGVLKVIVDFLQHHMTAGFQITADLPGQQYTFPQDIAPMDLRPDIVMWSTSVIYLVELTVPFETNIVGAAERKAHRYQELASACGHSHHTSIITLEVGSRGFLSITGFQQLYQLVQAKATDRAAFERDIIRHVVSSSYDIWCKRNWCS